MPISKKTFAFSAVLTCVATFFAALSGLNAAEPDAVAPVAEISTDVCVVGGGSAGVAAAIAAGRENVDVVLVEKNKILGGTATNAYVSNWEGGPGCDIAKELYEIMAANGGACVAREVSGDFNLAGKGAFGIKMADPNEPYENSLMRTNPPAGGYRSVVFLPEAFDAAARELIKRTGRVRLLDETTYFEAKKSADGRRVESVLVRGKDGAVTKIVAKVFIDSTGSVVLCRDLGCRSQLGPEARSVYDEPQAPENPKFTLNATTLCYRIDPKENAERFEVAPEDKTGYPGCAYVTGWRDGPRMVNMLPTLQGRELIELGYDECMKRAQKIVRNHWSWMQTLPNFENYELTSIAPELGIRESYRVVTRYVLRQADIEAGWANQTHDDMIAIADHACDIHGENGALIEVKTAYGVPYRCLIPEGELSNLLVACRGAGLSRIAAASCRLQRTTIQFGNAAGTAAAWAARDGVAVDGIDVPALVEKMDARKRYPR